MTKNHAAHEAHAANVAPRKRLSPLLAILQFLSGTLTIAGVLAGMFFTWAYWGVSVDTDTVTRTMERGASVQIETPVSDKIAQLRTDDPPVEQEPPMGELYAYIRVPALGVDWKRGIQQGVSDTILANMGAGHYPTTPLAGQVGNSAYAGHDTPGDFGAFYDLQAGDEIIIESASNWYVYRLTSHQITVNTDMSVLDADATGAERGITLTTCWPRFVTHDSGQRFVWHGSFYGWAPKSDGLPSSLAQTRVTTAEQLHRTLVQVSERVDMPVSGVVALCFALMWAAGNGVCWLFSAKQMRRLWQESGPTWNPVAWVWRLQAGVSDNRVVFTVFRVLWFLLLLAAIWFAVWRWVCPWAVDTFPWIPDTPHPSIG